MNLTDLKQQSVAELVEIATKMGLDNVARSRKQDVILVVISTKAVWHQGYTHPDDFP